MRKRWNNGQNKCNPCEMTGRLKLKEEFFEGLGEIAVVNGI